MVCTIRASTHGTTAPLSASLFRSVHEASRACGELHQTIPRVLAMLFSILQHTFPQLNAVSLDQFYAAINRAAPSLIRVEADELTYKNLHIMLRVEIEQALIEAGQNRKTYPDSGMKNAVYTWVSCRNGMRMEFFRMCIGRWALRILSYLHIGQPVYQCNSSNRRSRKISSIGGEPSPRGISSHCGSGWTKRSAGGGVCSRPTILRDG